MDSHSHAFILPIVTHEPVPTAPTPKRRDDASPSVAPTGFPCAAYRADFGLAAAAPLACPLIGPWSRSHRGGGGE